MNCPSAVSHLCHVALLRDVESLLNVCDDPLNDDVRVIDLDRVHDGLENVNGQLKPQKSKLTIRQKIKYVCTVSV